MNKYIETIHLFFQRYNRKLYYIIPILAILIVALVSNFLYIDKKVINKGSLWDIAGRPYETFLYELNLPRSVGAVFVAGTPGNLEKTEKYYNKIDIGDIFTSQIRSLFGKKITEFSIAEYINSIFGIFAILFSIFAGYLIFKNGYISIFIFLLIVILRNYSQGLIYGIPSRYTYAIFNPFLVFCIVIYFIIFLRNQSKIYLIFVFFSLSGLAIAYIGHIRTSEGIITAASLIIFATTMLLDSWRINRRDFKKVLINVSIVLLAANAGYLGYYKMVAAFEYHRDNKFNLPALENRTLTGHPVFHSLFISLFRYEIPNKYGDKIGYDAVYKKNPEIKKKYPTDVNYIELSYSQEYHEAIKKVYFDFIYHNPKHLITYVRKSIYDYILFLPYYSWTGNRSAHAYLPKINENVEIETQDLSPDFKDTSLNWILNLKIKYLPQSLLFWVYFIFAYFILMEAIYTSFVRFRIITTEAVLSGEVAGNILPIYLLRGMLIYFFFASIVRTLIPIHGQGAVVAFNIIIIYNLVRIVASIGIIETKKVKIPAIRIPAWLVLLVGISLSILALKGVEHFKEPTFNSGFKSSTRGWIAYKANLYSVDGGQSGNCLKLIASDNAISYAYSVIPTEVDKMYKIAGYYKKGNAGNGEIKVGTKMDVEDLYYLGNLYNADWKQYEGVFRAITPITYITLVNLSSIKGQTSFFDEVSIADAE